MAWCPLNKLVPSVMLLGGAVELSIITIRKGQRRRRIYPINSLRNEEDRDQRCIAIHVYMTCTFIMYI